MFQNAFSELMEFLGVSIPNEQVFNKNAKKSMNKMIKFGKNLMKKVCSKRINYRLDIDLKSPYIILPENGTLETGGNVLVIDLGGLNLISEPSRLQELEEATKMEIEEKLYDRFKIIISQLQILFSDSGDEWRAMRCKTDSDIHLLPRSQIKINFSVGILPLFKDRPKSKIDFHVTSIKCNISEDRLTHLFDFIKNFTLPKNPGANITNMKVDYWWNKYYNTSKLMRILNSNNYNLNRKSLHQIESKLKQFDQPQSIDTMSQTSLELQLYFPPSSDEDEKDSSIKAIKDVIDHPGFDDNISPENTIQCISRFCVEEINLGIHRSSSEGCRPYLMMKVNHVVLEIAKMDYGPALQFTVNSFHLVDKFYHGKNGEYLELISSPSQSRILNVLYRSVSPKCPDFRSHFHNTEKSLVVAFSRLNIVYHKDSLITAQNFFESLLSKFGGKINTGYIMSIRKYFTFNKLDSTSKFLSDNYIKWSIAARINNLNIKMCENEDDIFEVQLKGLESKYKVKNDFKKTMQLFLTDIIIEDLRESTLHSRLIEKEDDVIFEMKYDELSNSLDDSPNRQKTIANLDLRIGNFQIILLRKCIADILKFTKPVVSNQYVSSFFKIMKQKFSRSISCYMTSNFLTFRVNIAGPTVLIPQKLDSPVMIAMVFNASKIENFFSHSGIENILVEIGPIQINRAILTIPGEIEMQEPIIEPTVIKCDIKHYVDRSAQIEWDFNVNFGTLRVNLSQRDLNTILSIIISNRKSKSNVSYGNSSADMNSDVNNADEDDLRSLQNFVSDSTRKIKSAKMFASIDAVSITLYNDLDELLSSPVRDAATALACLKVGEIEFKGEFNVNDCSELRTAVSSFEIFDVRPGSNNIVKKILGKYVHSDQVIVDEESSTLFEVTSKLNSDRELNVDMIIDRIRMNIPADFCVSVFKYIADSIPTTDELQDRILPEVPDTFLQRSNTNVDSSNISSRSSSYASIWHSPSMFSSYFFKLLIQIKQPEILLLVDAEKYDSPVFLIKLDASIQYSNCTKISTWNIDFSDNSITLADYSPLQQNPLSVVESFNVNVSLENQSDVKEVISITASPIVFKLSPIVITVISKLHSQMLPVKTPDVKLSLPSADMENLWAPKKLTTNRFISNLNKKNPYCKNTIYPDHEININVSTIRIYFDSISPSLDPCLRVTSSISFSLRNWNKEMIGNSFCRLLLEYYNEEFSCWEPLINTIDVDTPNNHADIHLKILSINAEPVGMKRLYNGVGESDDLDSTDRSTIYSANRKPVFENLDQNTDSDETDSEMIIVEAPKTKNSRRRTDVDLEITGNV